MALEITIVDLLQVFVVLLGFVGSHFLLRERISVLEEKTKKFDETFNQVSISLRRIEDKVDRIRGADH